MRRVVTVAKNAGFCFGVARAAKAVEDEMGKKIPGQRIFTLGKLIHNDTYNARLAKGGVRVIEAEDLERLCDEASESAPVKVFVRAHGITEDTERILMNCSEKNPFFSFVDCTCVFVENIHKKVKENDSPDARLLVLGTATHPEVVGFCSRFHGEIFVFEKAEDLEAAIDDGRLKNDCEKSTILVAQTTQNLVEWEKTKKLSKRVFAKPLIYDTICNVTEKRQIEAAKLSGDNDLMIVIGSTGSSNSAKLYSICRAECENTVMVENADEMRQYFPCIHYTKVGIVAGASTPHDIIKEVEKTMSENFAELLETSLKTLNTGDTVTGYVTEVNDSEIYLDIGAKVTGVIKADKITDDPAAKLTEMFKIGDAVEAFVVRVSDVEGFATLDKKRVDSDKNWGKMVAAKENDEVLEGTVIETVKGNVGVIVLVDSTRVFVHASQTGTPKNSDLSAMVGKKVSLKLTAVENKRAKGSISAVLFEERKKAEAEFWASIEEGKQYTGKVKSMTAFGAFVDLGGVDGMVHTSELSWKRVKSPADVVAIGDEITVTVKSFDAEKKRISLTYKTDANNPWNIFKTNYAVGDIVSVKIVNMMPFGAFAEIVDGVDGLIHISQISMTKIAKPADVLEVGQTVDAKITEVDDEKKKVSLSIRALLEEAKALAEAMPEDEAVEADAE